MGRPTGITAAAGEMDSQRWAAGASCELGAGSEPAAKGGGTGCLASQCATGAALRRRCLGQAYGAAAGSGKYLTLSRSAPQAGRKGQNKKKRVLTCSVDNV